MKEVTIIFNLKVPDKEIETPEFNELKNDIISGKAAAEMNRDNKKNGFTDFKVTIDVKDVSSAVSCQVRK